MIKYKTYVEIERHVEKIKISGWNFSKNVCDNSTVTISGVVDGKKFSISLDGNMLLKDIVDKIVNEVS